MMEPRAIFKSTLLFGFTVGLLLGAWIVVVAPTQAHAEQPSKPKLLWEKTFERDIVAAGIDEDRFAKGKEDLSTCLKWILLRGTELRYFEEGGRAMSEALRGHVSDRSVSSSGKYLVLSEAEDDWWNKEEGVRYTCVDWEGKEVWKTRHRVVSSPLVRNDGSLVLPLVSGMCEVRLWGVKFFDPLGRVRKTYLVPKGWECRIIGSSENFVVLATQAPDKTREVSVLDKDGRVFWKQQVTKPGTGAVV